MAIAVSSSGRTFGAIAKYLALGRSGQEPERVAWSSARNLPSNDPELAARFMRATAEQNPRVQKPVYHIAISFDPADPVNRATMERVADRVLERLGLSEHEAILVSHRDREHAHVHVLVNRVHPVTGKAWDRWQDQPVIQQVLREEERALGIREVSGRLYQLPEQVLVQVRERDVEQQIQQQISQHGGDVDRALEDVQNRSPIERREAINTSVTPAREPVSDPLSVTPAAPLEQPAQLALQLTRRLPIPERPELTNGERRQAERSGDAPLVERLREHVPTLRTASSWAEMEAYLAYQGYRIERSGQGLALTDGTSYVKASRVARDISMGRLEARFGVSYDAYRAERERAIAGVGRPAWNERAREVIEAQADRAGARERGETDKEQRADVALVPPLPLVMNAEVRTEDGISSEPTVDRNADPITNQRTPAVTAQVASLGRQLETYEQVSALFGEHYAATQSLSEARAKLVQLEGQEARARIATQNLGHELASVYCDPAAARVAFDGAAVDRGIEATVHAMRDQPEQFGRLLTIQERRAFGVIRGENDASARQAALSAAIQGREAWNARAGFPAAAEERATRDAVPKAVEHERSARESLRHAPDRNILEREIGRVMHRLLPREIEDLRRAVTAPQFAVATKLKQAAREALLGREAPER